MKKMKLAVPTDVIERRIYLIRDQKVMLDFDLALLYHVKTKELNKSIKRNITRFPHDFMFRLNTIEVQSLRFQIGTSKIGRGGRRYLPYAFSEQGVAMLSSVLRSETAVQINIAIMRAFVRLRQLLATHKELADKLMAHERKLKDHDEDIRSLFDDLHQLLDPPAKTRAPIGFQPPDVL